ncbi:MAG: hypothetical protein HQ523_09865 [Lentisphaerae bacterium]|nr:hypothetical protein [Lentisphaerota bacterium]
MAILGVIGYAPYGLEWVLNKGHVFDGRLGRAKLLAQGAVEVTVTMVDGHVTECRLRATYPATARLLSPWDTPLSFLAEPTQLPRAPHPSRGISSEMS